MLAFEELGKALLLLSEGRAEAGPQAAFEDVVRQAEAENAWFNRRFIIRALANIGESLKSENLQAWLVPYKKQLEKNRNSRMVGVVMAGNVPLVGFHDFLCVLVSGNRFFGKLSSDDSKLLPYLAGRLIEFCPELAERIEFTEERLKGFDAVIATGSNNTSRYFEYYFRKYPHIIRKNRNGVAVLSGNETAQELGKLAEDVFLYFGLGCRNVSKLYVPKGFDFIPMLDAFSAYEFVINTNKYKNNYDYYRSIFLVNSVKHLDNGIIMVTESMEIASPPSVLYYEVYENRDALMEKLVQEKDRIQCVIGNGTMPMIQFGEAQKPQLWDYADGVDTLDFLLNLKA